ncbi:MAG: hypothetical protein EBZ67_02710 [Chitinophagia bacterium]|nr:hypothetical protein [Chitinophagia bacterium]
MSFDWGYRILAVYLVFVAGIGWMVYRSAGERVDLVTPDYYEQEVRYQERIEQQANAAALSVPVSASFREGRIELLLPPEFGSRQVEGELTLYCPSDAGKDIHEHFATTDRKAVLVVPRDRSGFQVLKLTFRADGKVYHVERDILIP